MKKWKKILLWVVGTVAVLYVGAVIWRIPHFLNLEKTEEQVAKIHATKLTIDDVMGKNLPPDPGAEADKTIAGVDVNGNGIRDDVELAIFKEYPNSAKVRSALLQYALALQLQMTLQTVNKETFTATVEDNDSRAHDCITKLFSRVELDKYLNETRNKPELEAERSRRLNVYVEGINKYTDLVENLQLNTESRKKYLHDIYEENLDSYSMSNDGCDIDSSVLLN